MGNNKVAKKNDAVHKSAEQSKLSKYANAPFFKKKDEDAIEFLKNHPLPTEFFKN